MRRWDVTWLIHISHESHDMTHSYVRLMRTHSNVTWLITHTAFICDTTHIHMWHVMTTQSYVTWLITHTAFICDMTRSYVTWLIDMRHDWQDMTNVHVTWWLIHKWHICSFYVTWLMTHTAFIRDMTRSYVKWLTTQNSLTCYTWWRLIDMWQEWWGRYRHVQRAYSTCVNRHVLS